MGLSDVQLQAPSRDQIGNMAASVVTTFESGKTRSLDFRRAQLEDFLRMVRENKDLLFDAVHKDLRKSYHEFYTIEYAPVIHEACDMIDNLDKYAVPDTIQGDMLKFSDRAIVRKEPVGAVLVLGHWTNPISMVLLPLVGVIASGCTCILKPSELATNTAQLIEELIPKYLDSQAYLVVNGFKPETATLIKLPWNHIYFSGNASVGSLVMQAAASNLTPVTLDLASKCPAIIADGSEIQDTAMKIIWSRLINAGQSNMAVDYVLCSEKTRSLLIPAFKKALESMFPQRTIQESPDYGRIVNIRHFKRIISYMHSTQGQIVIGGDSNKKELYIGPTVIVNPSDFEPLMVREVFGPILMVKVVDGIEDAVDFVNSRPNPLAVFVFCKNNTTADYVIDRVTCGVVMVNDTSLYQYQPELNLEPIGAAGIGSFRGVELFETFTHRRTALLKKGASAWQERLRFPPYNDRKTAEARRILIRSGPKFFPKLQFYHVTLAVLIVLVLAYFGVYYQR